MQAPLTRMMAPWAMLILAGLAPAAAQKPATDLPLERPIGVIECPKEVARQNEDVAFGAYILTHTFSEAAAKTLGLGAHAGRRVVLASAPQAEVGKQERAGAVAVLDPDSGACLKVLTAPYPMEVWRGGAKKDQFAGMQFGSNFCLSPEGGFLFVGCKWGGKGFVLNLASGSWFEITHPLMQVCVATSMGVAPDNAQFLNYGTKACFADEHTLYLVSNTQTYEGSGANLTPGVLLFEVKLDPAKGVTSMQHPAHRRNAAAGDARENGKSRGKLVNVATFRTRFGFRRDPAISFHRGRSVSNGFGISNNKDTSAEDICPSDQFNFLVGHEGAETHSAKNKGPLPFIERTKPHPQMSIVFPANTDDASMERVRFYPFHEDSDRELKDRPGRWQLSNIGIVDKRQNIGWVAGTHLADDAAGGATGVFGLFRWNDNQPRVFQQVRLSFDSKTEAVWRGAGVDVNKNDDSDALKPWSFCHLDDQTGRLYFGITGAKAERKRDEDAGRIYVFHLAPALKTLGWSQSMGPTMQMAVPANGAAGSKAVAARTFVTVTDVNGARAEARLVAPVEPSAAVIKIERADGREFEVARARLTAASVEALLAAALQDQQAALGTNEKAAATLQSLAQGQKGPTEGDKVVFAAKTLRGQQVRLEDYKGKIVLLDFWATWCQPCMVEVPELQRVYSDYAGRGFEIIGISQDQDKTALKNCIEDRKMNWVHCLDSDDKNSLAARFGVTGIPCGFLIDRDGKLIKRNVRADDLPELLGKLLPAQ